MSWLARGLIPVLRINGVRLLLATSEICAKTVKFAGVVF